jgi:hypothetical protein
LISGATYELIQGQIKSLEEWETRHFQNLEATGLSFFEISTSYKTRDINPEEAEFRIPFSKQVEESMSPGPEGSTVIDAFVMVISSHHMLHACLGM